MRTRNHFIDPREETVAMWACLGFFLVGFGSGYYHLCPSNETLVFDRIPMTIGFMAIFAMTILERISLKQGLSALPTLLAFGFISVSYWASTDDLRLYAFVQFFPMLAIPFMMWRMPPRYTGAKNFVWVVVWYVVAKLLEHFDHEVFALTGEMVSGHTLKHLAAAVATAYVVLYFKRRTPIAA